MKSEEDKTSFNRPNSTNSGILDPLNQLIQIINTNDMRERERERGRESERDGCLIWSRCV